MLALAETATKTVVQFSSTFGFKVITESVSESMPMAYCFLNFDLFFIHFRLRPATIVDVIILLE
jgi:hypothetical protein